jgi:hypothetical protein
MVNLAIDKLLNLIIFFILYIISSFGGGGGRALICFLNAYTIYLQSNKQMPYFEPPTTDVQHKIICKNSN